MCMGKIQLGDFLSKPITKTYDVQLMGKDEWCSTLGLIFVWCLGPSSLFGNIILWLVGHGWSFLSYEMESYH